jgi:hypothetical protein
MMDRSTVTTLLGLLTLLCWIVVMMTSSVSSVSSDKCAARGGRVVADGRARHVCLLVTGERLEELR